MNHSLIEIDERNKAMIKWLKNQLITSITQKKGPHPRRRHRRQKSEDTFDFGSRSALVGFGKEPGEHYYKEDMSLAGITKLYEL